MPSASSPSIALRLARPLGQLWLRSTGFRIEGEMPDVPKFVIIANPHESNWDLPYALAAGVHYGLRLNWIGKDSLFRWPYGGFMRWLGGISVDRSRSNNVVAGMIDTFDKASHLYIVVAPAGTRKAGTPWKSGFYHIAHGAKIPLVLGFIDYRRKTVGVKGVFLPTGDYEADLLAIKAIYGTIAKRERV